LRPLSPKQEETKRNAPDISHHRHNREGDQHVDALTPPDFAATHRELEESRDAMRHAIEARGKPDIVHVFGRVKHIHAEAKASEIFFEETKNAEAKHNAREARLGAECIMGLWLIELEEKKLRYMGHSKGHKSGKPPLHLITLDDLAIDKTESKQFQAVARLSAEKFAAFVASDRPTSALIQQLPEKRVLPLSAIRIDERAQPRAALLITRVVDEYAEAMQRGAKFPAPVVFEDAAGVFWPADGFHRIAAASKLKFKTIECEVHKGELRDAILYSCGANAVHGLPRTKEDKHP
jgi:hypothetical protein